MGLRNWLIKKLVGVEISQFRGVKIDDKAELLLKLQQDKFNRTLRDAEKINKANILRINERSLREELKQSLEDDEEDDSDEEEGEEGQDLEHLFSNILIKKLMGGDNNKLVGSGNSLPNSENLEQQALDSGVTPEQIQKFKEKMGIC